jgi:hypothetical protein
LSRKQSSMGPQESTTALLTARTEQIARALRPHGT